MYDDVTTDRFWGKVDKSAGHGSGNDCWIWTGEITHKGYGRARLADRKAKAAHRMSWELSTGLPWPEGKISRHTCDNPPCVNPAHIIPGTIAENNADMWERSRQAGPPAVNAKKTHCIRGHELSGDNVFEQVGGKRGCKECRRQRDRDKGPARKHARALYDKKRNLKRKAAASRSGDA